MTRSVTVLNPGALSLLQDSGRHGFQQYGVSVSGAMDPEALFIGNHLLGNDLGAAAIEVTFGGAEFRFESELVAVITGGNLQPSLDGTPLDNRETFVASAGSVLRFGAPVAGLRAYLLIEGGFDAPQVLGSRSTHVASGIGGLNGAPLAIGDSVSVGSCETNVSPGLALPRKLRCDFGNELTVRVVAGPQRSSFTGAGVTTFLSSSYVVSDKSDRQGLRLDGPVIEVTNGKYDIVSDAVVVGSVQVPGDGKPIILMSDRQTTGGYTKIAVVASVDLPLLAQATPGTSISFVEISLEEAQTLMRERRRAILDADIRSGIESRVCNVNVNGFSYNVGLRFRQADIGNPVGGMVEVSTTESRFMARVTEISDSQAQR
jgi:antagonist of KipI